MRGVLDTALVWFHYIFRAGFVKFSLSLYTRTSMLEKSLALAYLFVPFLYDASGVFLVKFKVRQCQNRADLE